MEERNIFPLFIFIGNRKVFLSIKSLYCLLCSVRRTSTTLSVHRWREVRPLWLFLMFHPFFSPFLLEEFFLIVEIFPYLKQGSKDRQSHSLCGLSSP